ncbi:methyl-accepting chemotaxis protein [Dactylosporangium sp. CA-139114]|uniref:methyl-accepting chemotaxis protein n=1 Tax=Dactylosporangium sp. CA-139114 TaxID=3239931 RepID=UPI003D98E004
MVRLVRHVRLRTRLALAFAVMCALLAGMAVIGERGSAAQEDASAGIGRLQTLSRQVMQLKFRDADVSGWQVAYAWDVPTLGGAAATADDSANRKGFLASASALRQELAAVDTGALTGAEQQLFATIKTSFASFLAYDQQVVTLYRTGTAASVTQANALIVGAGYDEYYKILENTGKLVDSVTARAEAAAAHSTQVARDSRRTMAIAISVAVTLCVAVAVLLALVITASVVRPADRVIGGLRELAARNLTVELPEDGRDEAADMAREFNAAVAGVREAVRQVGERAGALTAAGQELTALSGRLDGQASTTSGQTEQVARAAGGISGHVSTLASAAEQMNAAIDAIARSTGEAATVAGEAVADAAATSATVAQLSEAGAEIGAIVQTIAAIAAQTNLLALNATIEAARAGESGKGFAVVASEVKDLARETAVASEEITTKIAAIMRESTRAAAAIEGISAVVTRVAQAQTTIAAAMQEQSVTTAAISRSVGDVADGSQDIAHTIAAASQNASATTVEAAAAQRAAAGLAEMARELSGIAGSFQYR